MNRYARFRTWLIGRISEGASPRHVARLLRKYRHRFSSTDAKSWSDGSPEIPTVKEIDALSRANTWNEVKHGN